MEKKKYIIIGGNCLMSEDSFRDFNLANDEVEKAMARFIFPRNEWEVSVGEPGVEFVHPSDGMLKGIYHQIRDYADQEPRVWDKVTRDDLNSITRIMVKSRRLGYNKILKDMQETFEFKDRDEGFDIIAEKTRVMEMYDREYAGVDRYGNRLSNKKRRVVTNYTKPKKRRKKK